MEKRMRHMFRSILALVVLVALTAGCSSMTGKTAGQNVDDASITASVKTKLAAEKPATLTKVDVDTNKGTVYLTGNVETPAIKERATELARQVSGVREVVNNLKIQ
jgi:hyperosmotically inducible protein